MEEDKKKGQVNYNSVPLSEVACEKQGVHFFKILRVWGGGRFSV